VVGLGFPNANPDANADVDVGLALSGRLILIGRRALERQSTSRGLGRLVSPTCSVLTSTLSLGGSDQRTLLGRLAACRSGRADR